MYLINHFLDKLVAGVPAPDPDNANTTNAVSGVGSLGAQVATCAGQYGRNPNFMLVDVSCAALVRDNPRADLGGSSTNTATVRSSRSPPMLTG